MLPVLLTTLLGAALSVLAFPPFGPGILVVPGVALLLYSLRRARTRRQGLLIGFVYGLAFFAGLLWWLAELEPIALVLVPVQALFPGVFGWWLVRFNGERRGMWLLATVGGWGLMELVRYHYPVGGLEWGAAGYALSDSLITRFPASVVGTSGLTVLVVLLAAILVQLARRDWGWDTAVGGAVLVLVVGGSLIWQSQQSLDDVARPVIIVQGSTPCPFEHCPPDERLRTYQQHLALTEAIAPGTTSLVVWPESSTGSTNADPVTVSAIGAAIGEQARRIGAPMLVGSDRVVDDGHFVNANVYFDENGNIIGEYLKQHPVPFGEYIPLRPLFQWIPALDQVPRDMIPGDGPVVFPGGVGSVISFEGGFSRYALATRRAGAEVIVVNTNTASYGMSPASDIWIGMTRMRAVELGVPVIHAAVTGKSTVIDVDGSLGPVTGLGTSELLDDVYRGDTLDTPYTAIGDLLLTLAGVAGITVWGMALVGSRGETTEED